MDVDHVPELVGNGVRLRELRDSDIPRRASLGRSREIARGFGAGLDADEPILVQSGDGMGRDATFAEVRGGA